MTSATANGGQPALPVAGSAGRLAVVPSDGSIVAKVRQRVAADGVGALQLDDLHLDDLETIDWSAPLHLAHVAEALERALRGEVEYLAVRAPAGQALAMAGIDFATRPGVGTLWQLLTHPELRGLGLGSRLVAEAEVRIERRGCRYAVLGVEDNNPRARRLYESLGYMPFGREATSWLQDGPNGRPEVYETEITLLRKAVSARRWGGRSAGR